MIKFKKQVSWGIYVKKFPKNSYFYGKQENL